MRALFKRHPFTEKREWNTRAARERDAWIEEANRLAKGEQFWRDRCKARCARDGHTPVRCEDDSADYCTCCGAVGELGA